MQINKIDQLGSIIQRLEDILDETDSQPFLRLFPTFQPSFDISYNQTSQNTIRHILLKERQSMDDQITKNYASYDQQRLSLESIDLNQSSPTISLETQIRNIFKEGITQNLGYINGQSVKQIRKQLQNNEENEKTIAELEIIWNIQQGISICQKTLEELSQIHVSYLLILNASRSDIDLAIKQLKKIGKYYYFQISQYQLMEQWIPKQFSQCALILDYQCVLKRTQQKIQQSIFSFISIEL